jgi:hypothetical protein
VPAQQIAQNLAYINWTVLTGLAFGALAAGVVGRALTEAPRGYLMFTALCAAAFAGLAYLSDTALPASLPGSRIVADPAFDLPRRLAIAAMGILAVVELVVLRRRGRTRAAGIAGVAAGLAAFLFAALSWSGGGPAQALPLLVQLVVLGSATGGVFAAMVLGHWYLVSPKLGEAPLVLMSRLLLWVVAVQLALFVAWLAAGAGAGRSPFEPLVGQWALFVWLRLLIGLVFPLIVSWAAVKTAMTRSMESATGLLYINVGAIAAGTILAAGLYFGAGLLL